MNPLSPYLEPGDILLDLAALDRAALFAAVGRHLEQRHGLARDSVAAGLTRRELAASTGLGHGLAIPHCRVAGLERILAAYLRLKEAIPFNAPDGMPVDEYLVLLVPKQASEEHLEVLAAAAGMFSDQRFRARLRQCADAQAVRQVFATWTLA